MLVLCALIGFAVLGQHLLSGIMHGCSDPTIFERNQCVGLDRDAAPRSWEPQVRVAVYVAACIAVNVVVDPIQCVGPD